MFKNLIAVTTMVTVASLTTASLLHAADIRSQTTLSPLQAVSFKAGGTNGVGYFLNDEGQCRVIVTSAGDPNLSDGSFSSSRVETAIADGTTQTIAVGSKQIALNCRNGGQAMDVAFDSRQFAEAEQ